MVLNVRLVLVEVVNSLHHILLHKDSAETACKVAESVVEIGRDGVKSVLGDVYVLVKVSKDNVTLLNALLLSINQTSVVSTDVVEL